MDTWLLSSASEASEAEKSDNLTEGKAIVKHILLRLDSWDMGRKIGPDASMTLVHSKAVSPGQAAAMFAVSLTVITFSQGSAYLTSVPQVLIWL